MIQKAIMLCIALAGVFVAGWFAGGGRGDPAANLAPPPRIHDTATILRQIQASSQLVTVQYVLEKLVVLDDVKWYGNNRVILVAHGIVKAGIDLSRIEPGDIEILEHKILIRLPAAAVTDVYLDEEKTHVLERTTSVMRTFDRNMEQTARRQAVDELSKSAKELGIAADAEERARLQLTHLFHQLGFEEIEFLR